MVIVIGNGKGGVGKSTVATNLATIAACEGQRVLLVDADPQKSSINYAYVRTERADKRPMFRAMELTKPILHEQVPEISKDYDRVYIDVGGRDTKTFRSAMMAADMIVVPILTSQFDIWEVQSTFEIINEAKVYRKNLDTVLLVNQVNLRTKVAAEAVESLKDFDVPVLNTFLHSRVAFKQSVSEGLSVLEFKKTDSAAEEMLSLYREIEGRISDTGGRG